MIHITIGLSKSRDEWRAGVFDTTIHGKGMSQQEAIQDAVEQVKAILQKNYPEGVIEVEI